MSLHKENISRVQRQLAHMIKGEPTGTGKKPARGKVGLPVPCANGIRSASDVARPAQRRLTICNDGRDVQRWTQPPGWDSANGVTSLCIVRSNGELGTRKRVSPVRRGVQGNGPAERRVPRLAPTLLRRGGVGKVPRWATRWRPTLPPVPF